MSRSFTLNLLHAKSIKSIALSGNFLSVMYFTESLTVPGVTVDVSETDGSSQAVQDQIGSAFEKLRDGTAGHNNYWSVQTVSSDEMQVGQKGGDWYDGGIWLDMHQHIYTAASGPLTNTYNTQYNAISEVNLITTIA